MSELPTAVEENVLVVKNCQTHFTFDTSVEATIIDPSLVDWTKGGP
jgi:hypothetical protein